MEKIANILIVIGILFLFYIPAWGDFLPVPNGEQFRLEYGESISGIPANPPKIDGNLDDWRYAVWIAFDSDEELFRGQGSWKGKDDLSVTWSTMYDKKNFYFAAAVRDDLFSPSSDAAQPWLGDTIFLYIDWANQKVEVSSKPNFALIKGKALVSDSSGGKNHSYPNRKLLLYRGQN